MLYWATGAFVTSARYYAEVAKNPWRPSHDRHPVVEAPTGITFMAQDMTSQGRGWTEEYYNLVWTRARDRGGHFAAPERPAEIVEDIREALRPYR